MNNMTLQLYTIQEMVEQILVSCPETRSSDDLLVDRIYHQFYGINKSTPFHEVMLKRSTLGLPAYESIRRARQRLQQNHEFLRGDKRTEELRLKAQEGYLEYARG